MNISTVNAMQDYELDAKWAASANSLPSQSWLQRLLNVLLVIKRVPWFTLVLLILMGYGTYQVITRPHSTAHIWLRRSINQASHSLWVKIAEIHMKKPKPVITTTPTVDKEVPPAEAFKTEVDENVPLAALEKDYALLQSTVKQLEQDKKELQGTLDTLKAELATAQNYLSKSDEPAVTIIDQLEQEKKALQTSVDTLQAQLVHVNKGEVAQETNVTTQLEQEKMELQREVAKLKKELRSAQTPVASHQTVADKQAVETETSESAQSLTDFAMQMGKDYSVHAVVQGRAWLNTKAGQIVTVSVGSQLPMLGTVQAIDMDNRLVYFDTGGIIGPSPFDS